MLDMNKNLSITAILGLTAVILGAFASHSLKEKLTVEAMYSVETAIRYQMYHVIVVLFVNIYTGFTNRTKNMMNWLFFTGIFLFSGSIYAIYLLAVPAKAIWFITPLGGVFFILGWLYLCIFFMRNIRIKNNK